MLVHWRVTLLALNSPVPVMICISGLWCCESKVFYPRIQHSDTKWWSQTTQMGVQATNHWAIPPSTWIVHVQCTCTPHFNGNLCSCCRRCNNQHGLVSTIGCEIGDLRIVNLCCVLEYNSHSTLWRGTGELWGGIYIQYFMIIIVRWLAPLM